jgi:hypothetical protein
MKKDNDELMTCANKDVLTATEIQLREEVERLNALISIYDALCERLSHENIMLKRPTPTNAQHEDALAQPSSGMPDDLRCVYDREKAFNSLQELYELAGTHPHRTGNEGRHWKNVLRYGIDGKRADLAQPKGDFNLVKRYINMLSDDLERKKYHNKSKDICKDGCSQEYRDGWNDLCDEIIDKFCPLVLDDEKYHAQNTTEKDRVMKDMAEALRNELQFKSGRNHGRQYIRKILEQYEKLGGE